jgi:hypothetical protein
MKAPPGVEILGDKHIPVLSVAAPVSEAQEAAALESATTPSGEVEMLKEKKEDGAEGESKAGEKGAAPAKGGDKAPKAGEKAAAAPAEKAGEKKPEKKK